MYAGRSEYASALSMGEVGLWPALNDALLMFPLTKSLRLALLNLLCSQQVGILPQYTAQSNLLQPNIVHGQHLCFRLSRH